MGFLQRILVATDGAPGTHAQRFATSLANHNAGVMEFCTPLEVIEREHDRRSDAIVIGTDGAVDLERAFAESSEQRALQGVDVPVFVVAPTADVAPRFGRILVAVDNSQPGDAALAFAIDFAAAEHAQLAICSVVEENRVTLGGELRRSAQAFVQSASDRAHERRVHCERYVVEGDPAAAIVELAVDVSAGIIVLGSHRRRGLTRWILGNIASDIARRGPVPLAVVRDGAQHHRSAA